jgi:hypothetical protein
MVLVSSTILRLGTCSRGSSTSCARPPVQGLSGAAACPSTLLATSFSHSTSPTPPSACAALPVGRCAGRRPRLLALQPTNWAPPPRLTALPGLIRAGPFLVLHFGCNQLIFHSDELKRFTAKLLILNEGKRTLTPLVSATPWLRGQVESHEKCWVEQT